MRNVLLFGTSGNPPTGRDGHSGIVDYFASLGVCVLHDDALESLAASNKHAGRRWQ